MFGIKNFFRKKRPNVEALTSMSLDYATIEAIGKRIDRTVEIQLTDGTVIRIFDRQANTKSALAYY
jgi:hypothetical protein